RPYERGMDRNYIDSLRLAYEGFFTAYTQSPVLVIDTNRLNIIGDDEAYLNVRERIRSALGAGTFQQTLPQMNVSQEAGLPHNLTELARPAPSPSPLHEFAALTQSIGMLGAILTDGADSIALQESLQTIMRRVKQMANAAGVKITPD
ncbi:MAG TPA: hypothetical protein VFK30_06725, partial [Anaerolineae bacterium]|nr:hypothetical protein [Anaerolineae bacterium]